MLLAVDLGGTWLRTALVEPDGRIVSRSRVTTPRDGDIGDVVAALRDSGLASCEAVVLGTAGRVNYRTRCVEVANNLPATWAPDLTSDRLADLLDRPVWLVNDVDLAAVGEAWNGASAGYASALHVWVGTGVGMAVVADGRLVHTGRTLEAFDMPVTEADTWWEACFGYVADAQALQRAATRYGLPGAEAVLAAVAPGPAPDDPTTDGPDRAPGADGAAGPGSAAGADSAAGKAWAEWTAALARGTVSLVNLFTPEVVVLGGGLAGRGDLVADPVRRLLEREGPMGLPAPVTVVTAQLGDDAPLIGAAHWAASQTPEPAPPGRTADAGVALPTVGG